MCKPARTYFFSCLFFITAAFVYCDKIFAQNIAATIDSLKKNTGDAKESEQYIKNCFAIADNFMEIDQYDSSQTWLNKIAEVLPFKTPSVFSYFLSTRQAEVYYYNGLQRLGLQESERSLGIAQALHDSLLLADAYNFIGLFLINLDSNAAAIPYFKRDRIYQATSLSQYLLKPYQTASPLW